MVSFELSKDIENDVFLSCHKHGTKKNDKHCLQATLVNLRKLAMHLC